MDTPTSLGAADFNFWCGTVAMPDSVRLSLYKLFVLQVPESEEWRVGDPTALLTVGAN